MKILPDKRFNTNKPTMHLKIRPRQTILPKKVVVASAFLLILFIVGIIFYFQFGRIENLKAAVTGDYRSIGSGNWSNTAIWERYNGTSWATTVTAPSSAESVITIQNGHTVTVSGNVTADQVVVDAGGTLSISSGKTLTIANGTGDDLTINGTLNITGTLANNASSDMVVAGNVTLLSGGANNLNSSSHITINNGGRYKRQDATMTTTTGIWTINSGGTFQQDIDGGSLPLATWNPNSTCEVTGVTVTKPSNLIQSFYNFTWNSPNQTSAENLQGDLSSISGDFNFISSGTGLVRLGQPENYNMSIGGNLNMQGGSLFACTKSTGCTINITGNYVQTGGTFGGTDASLAGEKALGVPTINVTGDFSISAGTFDMTQNFGTSSGNGIATLNLSGNFSQTGGTITETATTTTTYGYGRIYFAKVGTQTFSKTAGTMSNTLHITVNSSSVLDMGTSYPTGGGNFTLMSGGGLNLGSPNGITQSSASGNVQVTGTRSYSTGGDYTYNGASAQVTGDGLPSTIHNLTFNNSSGSTLTASTSVSNALTFTSGNLTTSNDTLTLGTSTAVLGTLTRTSGQVVGAFRRWIAAAATSNILFPVGTTADYKGANISYTTAPTTGGTITTIYNQAILNTGGSNFLDASDSIQALGNGYWSTAGADGLSGGVFSLDLTATNLFGVSNYNALHLIKRNNSGAAWGGQGNHSSPTGSNAAPVLHRTGLTALVHFGVGSPRGSNVLPIHLIYFNALLNNKHVDLSWATATEINNDHFTVERSTDGIHFTKLLEKPGAGNSTSTLYYSAVDENPLPGVSYFRLKQTDYDGHFSYSAIKSVNIKSGPGNETSIEINSVAPNPFSDRFRISFTLKAAGQVNFMLINSSGQLITTDIIPAGEGINQYDYTDEKGLPPGIYFANLMYGNEKITQKIIKRE